jgi:hypothetical protein
MIWKAIRNTVRIQWYLFIHWFFQWTVDEDNAITLTVMGRLNLTKYKEHTIVKWKKGFKRAPRYVELPKETACV